MMYIKCFPQGLSHSNCNSEVIIIFCESKEHDSYPLIFVSFYISLPMIIWSFTIKKKTNVGIVKPLKLKHILSYIVVLLRHA